MLARAFRAWGHWHLRRLVARGLDGVHVDQLDALREAASRGPLILAANHVAWWDGLLAVLLSRVAGLDARVLMDAKRLRQHSFFAAFGAIPIGDNPRKELSDAAAHLVGPGRALWIFPQGRQRPEQLRPLEFKGGVATLARLSGAAVLPIGLRYAMLESPAPAAVVRVGAPLELPSAAEVEAAVTALLDAPWPGDKVPGTPLWPAKAPSQLATRALRWLYDGLLGAQHA